MADTYICAAGIQPGMPAASTVSRRRAAPAWNLDPISSRKFESAESNRLNKAHWQYADDQSVNVWLASQLSTIRARATYEARNNPILQGVIKTHADDIVGRDGPSLQVQSDDDQFNDAAERVWRDWFRSPTTRQNVSGAQMLKLWIRGLWRSGELLAKIVTDPTVEGPVSMRLRPLHPRNLGTPLELTADPNVVMGIRFNSLGQPTTYYLADSTIAGDDLTGLTASLPWPADLVLHEFVVDEEDQARGIPLANAALPTAADLRDYTAQVQDAARQMADQSCLLYTDHPDAELWENPESMTVKRRVIGMVPPGWKPFTYAATQPPATYETYLAERMREIGRPVGMPLLMVRLDASRHNYSSARLDTQVYRRSVAGLQAWLSGTDRSCGALSRLLDIVIAEARFAEPALRTRPRQVIYAWTWPVLPHVDPAKESQAEEQTLANATETLTDAVAARGHDLETHIATLVRERQLLIDAGIAPPPWMSGSSPEPEPIDAAAVDEQIAAAAEEADVE